MAVDFLGALGVGSDIDSQNLVQSLVDAERAPKEATLNNKIDKAEFKISANGKVLGNLSTLVEKFSYLNDLNDFKDYTVNVSGALALDGSPAFSVAANTDIAPGITELQVVSVATADRWVSDEGFASLTEVLNAGNGFSLDLTVAGQLTVVNITDPTPQAVVDAINDSELGITAELVDTGAASDPYKILLAGPLGLNNSVLVTSSAASGKTLNFDTKLSTASNAELSINGLDVQRTTNVISDLLEGATLTISAPTAGTATVAVEQDYSGIEERIRDLVETYNTVEAMFDSLVDPESSEELGGIFSGDSSIRLIRDKIRTMFTRSSSTATDNVAYLSDMGVTLTRSGELQIDDTKLNQTLTTRLTDVVSMFSADTNNQTTFGDAARGLAGDAINELEEMMASEGTLLSQTRTLEAQVKDYAESLEDLDRRMQQVKSRYLAQFTAMETAIEEMNNLRDYLSSQLEALPFNRKD